MKVKSLLIKNLLIAKLSPQCSRRSGLTVKYADVYEGIYRMWLGNNLPEVRIQRCDYAEDILKSSKHLDKSNTYKLLEPWLGRGEIFVHTWCDVFIKQFSLYACFSSHLIDRY